MRKRTPFPPFAKIEFPQIKTVFPDSIAGMYRKFYSPNEKERSCQLCSQGAPTTMKKTVFVDVMSLDLTGLFDRERCPAPESVMFLYEPASYTGVKVSPRIDLSRFPHSCPRCGAAAYVGFTSVDCSQGCR